MSFLNPVSEPVLRFSSTDAGAPQINYNARVAGDIKTVLKACLVTGYGAKSSAGWSVANEVDHVAEFVSPSAVMSDYRLGIDDTSASSTTWYYQYQDARVNPSYNAPTKSFSFVDKLHANNGWQLLVTERGLVFIELVQHTAASKLSARITYWGRVKSALFLDVGENIMFFNVGHSSTINPASYFYSSSSSYLHVRLGTYKAANISASTSSALSAVTYLLDKSVVDLVSPIYLSTTSSDLLLAEIPAALSKVVNNPADIYGVSETTLGSRLHLSVCAGFANSQPTANNYSRTFLIPLDYWEY